MDAERKTRQSQLGDSPCTKGHLLPILAEAAGHTCGGLNGWCRGPGLQPACWSPTVCLSLQKESVSEVLQGLLHFEGLSSFWWEVGILNEQNVLQDPGGSVVKNPPAYRRWGFDFWVRKNPWRRKWQPTPVFFPGKSHGQRSLVAYSPWGHKRVRHNLTTKQQQQI